MRSQGPSMVFLVILLIGSISVTSAGDALTPALYVLGDSLSDPGNNNYLKTLAKANFSPYGIDFVDGPTGRFTNGKTIVDFLAEKLGLPYPPAFLSLSEEMRDNTTTGVNYASGGCGILDKTGSNVGTCLSLKRQIQLFKKTSKTIARHFKSKNDLRDYLAKSIFIVNIGSNDYINNYLQKDFFNTSIKYNPEQFAEYLNKKLYKGIEKLHILGARKFVLYNIGLIGCMPIMRATRHGRCLKAVNNLVLPFNKKLPNTVHQLRSNLEGVAIVHQRRNPLNSKSVTKIGIKHIDTPCCPCCIPLPQMNSTCYQAPCSNRDEYAYWDIFHPSQKIYSVLAEYCFDKWPSKCDPYSIKKLAQM